MIAQTFTGNTNDEYPYPDNMAHYSNTSAYSSPSYKTGGNFIYVHTWDNGDSGPNMGGFAVQEYTSNDVDPMNLYGSQYSVDLADVGSVEAFIAEDGTHEYHVILTYYNFANSTFEIRSYHWDATMGLTPSGGPFAIAGNGIGTNVPFGWIRNDVIEYYDFAITWSTNNQLFVVGGNFFASGLTLSNPLEIGQGPGSPTVFIGGFDRPDIALNRSQYGGALAHLVFTDNTHTELGVIRIPLGDILSASSTPTPLPYAAITSQLVDYQTTSGTYFYPRIDAFDYLTQSYEAWSYVVQEEFFDGTDWFDYIFTGVYDNFIVNGFNHYVINNDSYFITLDDIDNKNNLGNLRTNSKPVVAFGLVNRPDAYYAIYYGWYLENGQAATGLSANNNAFIGLKIDAGANLAWTPTEYFVIPQYPDNTTTDNPSLAFSGNNHQYNTGLYMAFTQEYYTGPFPPPAINIGYKVTQYSSASFRPQPPGEEEVITELLVHPNPFDKGFTIKIAQDKGETYSLKITNILGRSILENKGTIQQLNTQLITEPTKWQTGQYILQLKNETTGEVQIKKLAAMR